MSTLAHERVQVAVRIRPLLPNEGRPELSISTRGSQGILVRRDPLDAARRVLCSPKQDGKTEVLNFDHAWSGEVTQDTVFDRVKPLIDGAFEGYNSTIFAYGPSGSGKTHTMMGAPHAPGIVPRAVHRVIDLARAQPDHMFVYVLSVLELYQDQFFDLLDDDQHSNATPAKRRRDHLGPKIAKIEVVRNGKSSQLRGNFTRLQVNCPDAAVTAIEAAFERRATSGTRLNDRSSRSHAVVMLQVQQASVDSTSTILEPVPNKPEMSPAVDAEAPACCSQGVTTVGTLYMVDLAGSERIKLSGVSGEELEEAKHINKSLSALGNVLNALTDRKAGLVPYRDSKLTLMLQDALGGNSKTMMITCINPKQDSLSHSMVALQYATRAKAVTNLTSVNLDEDKSSQIELLKRQLADLQRRLADRKLEYDAVSSHDAAEMAEKAAQVDKMQQLMALNQLERQELEDKLAHVVNGSQLVIERERAAYEHLEGQLRNYSGELEVALTAHQEALGQIEALEAARKQEELAKENLLRDKDDWLRAQAALQERNLALERRVQELEAAAGAGTKRPAKQSLLLPSSGNLSMHDSPYHCRNSPVVHTLEESHILQDIFPGLKGKVMVTSPSAPAAAEEQESYMHAKPGNEDLLPRSGEGLGKTDARYSVGVGRGKARLSLSLEVPESPGDILVRDLDTGETVPVKHAVSRLSNRRFEEAKDRLRSSLQPLRALAATNASRPRLQHAEADGTKFGAAARGMQNVIMPDDCALAQAAQDLANSARNPAAARASMSVTASMDVQGAAGVGAGAEATRDTHQSNLASITNKGPENEHPTHPAVRQPLEHVVRRQGKRHRSLETLETLVFPSKKRPSLPVASTRASTPGHCTSLPAAADGGGAAGASGPAGGRTERLQRIVESLKKETVTRVKRVSSSLFPAQSSRASGI